MFAGTGFRGFSSDHFGLTRWVDRWCDVGEERAIGFPTHADNSPNSLAEAMAVGTPCVASAAGGIPTLAREGVDALLVQDDDPYALAGTILRLIDDRALARAGSPRTRRTRATALALPAANKVRMTMLEIYRSIISDAGTAGAARGAAATHED